MSTIAIHQPNYIPWLGYFYKIFRSDYFVFLDDAQYSNKGMHNYHYIKTPGGPQRIKIPVKQTLGDPINRVRLRDELCWKDKHLSLLKNNYFHADYFDEVFNDFTNLIMEDYTYLSELNTLIISFICNKLGFKTSFLNSSELEIHSHKMTKIIDICTAVKCNVYYSGTGARAYQDEKLFLEKGINLKYSEYKIFTYKQQFQGFQSNVTILDLTLSNTASASFIILKATSLTTSSSSRKFSISAT